LTKRLECLEQELNKSENNNNHLKRELEGKNKKIEEHTREKETSRDEFKNNIEDLHSRILVHEREIQELQIKLKYADEKEKIYDESLKLEQVIKAFLLDNQCLKLFV
jgi:chromosome segregation ATPase